MNHGKDTVYSCKKIISQSLDRTTKDDFALIELDRKVKGRTPLKFRTSGKPSVGDELVVIGHPSGLPTKIADGAQVKTLEGTHFLANLDTYGGNSGSAVFNVATGEIEGILVRGATDYVVNGNCRTSNRIGNDEGEGEGVTYITNIKALMDM
jgi:V8-like Glu-specific endopeptidase